VPRKATGVSVGAAASLSRRFPESCSPSEFLRFRHRPTSSRLFPPARASGSGRLSWDSSPLRRLAPGAPSAVPLRAREARVATPSPVPPSGFFAPRRLQLARSFVALVRAHERPWGFALQSLPLSRSRAASPRSLLPCGSDIRPDLRRRGQAVSSGFCRAPDAGRDVRPRVAGTSDEDGGHGFLRPMRDQAAISNRLPPGRAGDPALTPASELYSPRESVPDCPELTVLARDSLRNIPVDPLLGFRPSRARSTTILGSGEPQILGGPQPGSGSGNRESGLDRPTRSSNSEARDLRARQP